MTEQVRGIDRQLGVWNRVEQEATITVAATSAHAEGAGKITGVSTRSHAENFGTCSGTGNQCHAEGSGTCSGTGSNNHAEGLGTATANFAHAEGASTTASAANSHAEGNTNTASGVSSHAEGTNGSAAGIAAHSEGIQCAAGGNYSHAEGGRAVTPRLGQHGKSSSGAFATNGDQQHSNYVQGQTTSSATPALLSADGGIAADFTNSAGGSNVLTLPASRAFFFRAEVVARRTDVEGTVAAFTVMGAVSREASGTPRLVGTPVTVTWADVAASTWTVVPSVVNPSGALWYLAFTVTGEAAKTLQWVSTLFTTEVG
jgi:hypothetical protein